MPKYPEITAQLSGEDGNVFAVIGRVAAALKKGGVAKEEVDRFREAAMSSDSYDAVLRLCMEWVEVE
jgi:hypothetical protein